MTVDFERLKAALADRFAIEGEIGHGGMALVYVARDLKHHRQVAVKVLRPALAASLGPERFHREIETAANLNHPHILPLLNSGEADGFLYYVMPYMVGESLRQRINREAQLPLEDALKIATEVADGLDHAHRNGVVHRDIKPANILLQEGHALISDFGIAKAVSEAGEGTLTGTGIAVGSPKYMSPEQVVGNAVDERSDIYSLGCVLYEMLVSEPPFAAATPEAVMARRFSGAPPSVQAFRNVPDSVDGLVSRAMAPAPADRFSTAAEFVGALEDSQNVPRGAWKVPPSKGRIARLAATAVLLVGAIGFAYSRLGGPEAISSEPTHLESIAVLPFIDLSPAGDQEYFSEGMAEEILDALTRIPDLRVAARTSSFRFSGADVDVRAIGDSLGVEAILEGSVRKDGDQVRITAQLISAEDGFHLWSETYDRQLASVFVLQEEIARAIVEALDLLPPQDGPVGLVTAQTEDLDAYNLYLKGRHFWNLRTEEGLETAVGYFQQAIARDSLYALAFAGLADAYSALGAWGYVPEQEVLPDARAAADRALELDENLAEAHTARALVLYREKNFEDAEQAFQRAIALNPGYASAHQWYGILLSVVGRPEPAIRELRRAHELDPLSAQISTHLGWQLAQTWEFDEALEQYERALELNPDNPWVYAEKSNVLRRLGLFDEALPMAQRAKELNPVGNSTEVAWVFHWARDYDAALRELHEVIELQPDLFSAHWLLSQVYAAQGRYEEAIDEHRKIEELNDNPFIALNLLFIYARSGEPEKARAILAELEQLEGQPGWDVNTGWIGAAYAWLGDYDLAFEWLDLAVELRSASLTEFKVDQWADALRSDPRFGELLRNVGLAEGA